MVREIKSRGKEARGHLWPTVLSRGVSVRTTGADISVGKNLDDLPHCSLHPPPSTLDGVAIDGYPIPSPAPNNTSDH
jgi:hypothetical protein